MFLPSINVKKRTLNMLNYKKKYIIAIILCIFLATFKIATAKGNQPSETPPTVSKPQQEPHIRLSPEEQLWVKDHPTITVSNEFDWPPFDFTLSGKPHGFGIDLMNLISEYSGIQFQYINGFTWDQLVEMYSNGEIDILHSVSMTPEREKYSYFSPPYFHSKNVLIFRQDTPESNNLKDLEGKIIALPKGWSSIEFFRTHYPKVHIVEVASTRQALEYVEQGKVFATVEQKEIAQYFMKKFGFHDLRISQWIENNDLQKTSSMHFAVLKENPVLYQILIKAQNNIPPETFEALNQKWFSREGRALGREDVGLTPDERRFLIDHDSISYCVPPEAMPFSAIKNGQITGMTTDYIDIFSEKLGIPFRLIPVDSWEESNEKFLSGECEIYPMVSMPGKLKDTLDVTSPILHFQGAIITRENEEFIAGLQHFVGKKLAIVKYGITKESVASRYPHIEVLAFKNTQECLLQVANGTADGALLALPVAAYYIRHLGLSHLKIAGYSGSEGAIRIGVKKDLPHLHSIMSKLIRSIPQSDINAVYQKWISLRFEHKPDHTLLWKVVALITFVVILVLLWNRQLFKLNKKIAEANKKLEEKSEELERLSITDGLTGLYNRRHADNRLAKEMVRADRYNGQLSLIMADLDFFKKVNDVWGHQAGDSVLQGFSTILSDNTRETDLVSRWGGEEFLIICPQTDLQGAMTKAENLRRIFANTTFKDIGSKTASFGIAAYLPGENKNSLVKRADDALYRAKDNGRNRVESSK